LACASRGEDALGRVVRLGEAHAQVHAHAHAHEYEYEYEYEYEHEYEHANALRGSEQHRQLEVHRYHSIAML
jgi:hypothetical protein